MIERFFAEITRESIRRGVFESVKELETAIYRYLEHHNENPTPFTRSATADKIIEKVNRGKQALMSEHQLLPATAMISDNLPFPCLGIKGKDFEFAR